MSRKTFTPEFKQECVELVIRQGYQVKQAAIAMRAIVKSGVWKITRHSAADLAPRVLHP